MTDAWIFEMRVNCGHGMSPFRLFLPIVVESLRFAFACNILFSQITYLYDNEQKKKYVVWCNASPVLKNLNN